ncbi:MAG: aminoacetone oxidase family FAD-binding enzyme [Phycisphaerales bacterium]|nr:aminoacetone oxidase family FAD-binding enzyme [Phycisphaerales bacterium]
MDAPRRERDGAPALPSDVDVVVVGAGAAGLMAAIQASRRGRRTLLLEKQQRPGLKILISGGGRCNLTTTRAGSDLEAQYGAARGRFLRHALRAFPPKALRAFVEQAGVPLQEEDLDKLFPVSQKARDVVDALLRVLAQSGARLALGTPVRDVAAHAGGGFTVRTDRGDVQAASVVLATGGLSYPKTGATGDGYPWCRALGHTVTATWPALAPLAVAEPWVRELQGIVLHGVALTSLDAARRPVTTRVRPILFTHKGLSGPAPMDLAGDVEEAHGAAAVRFDFAPDRRDDELEAEWLALAAAHGGRRASSVLPAALPERVRAALCAHAGGDVLLANWPRPQRRALVAATKNLVVPVARSLGYDHAEVTRGGVALGEIDARTMQSKVRPGLFVCGELLDVDGPIGGFNFQAAFATGRLAGLHA